MLTWQFPSFGHSAFFLQLQFGLSSYGFDVTFLLCPLMIFDILFMQLLLTLTVLPLKILWSLWLLVTSTFDDWFIFSGNLHRYGTCWSTTNHLNIPTFWIQKYGHFSIRASAIHSWNYTQYALKINLSLKNPTPNSIKYFLTILLEAANSFSRLNHNLHGIYETIHVLHYFM